jgi:hypothetical protein
MQFLHMHMRHLGVTSTCTTRWCLRLLDSTCINQCLPPKFINKLIILIYKAKTATTILIIHASDRDRRNPMNLMNLFKCVALILEFLELRLKLLDICILIADNLLLLFGKLAQIYVRFPGRFDGRQRLT